MERHCGDTPSVLNLSTCFVSEWPLTGAAHIAFATKCAINTTNSECLHCVGVFLRLFIQENKKVYASGFNRQNHCAWSTTWDCFSALFIDWLRVCNTQHPSIICLPRCYFQLCDLFFLFSAYLIQQFNEHYQYWCYCIQQCFEI